ncbi:hypothetical protein CBR_g449 [Chara braunii]|uniref:Integrase catalytic domain-containing protein n=1 Tax=Chara braunii TaxID=69332 RepID=A0A388KB80_CHABU|nr:hypothetical protein CBR_g449 [Chara braunii]|eukprot:GBG67310.1 hypothetical protein CBR_g449 [Chara braunii]
MSGGGGAAPRKALTLDDLVEALDKRERASSNVPKVDTFHFKGERVSDWLDLTEQALVGLSDEVKFQRILNHGGGSEKLTWETIDKGVEEGSLDQVEQHQMRPQRRKRKERDATASGTPGVKRIVTDVLVALGYDNKVEVQKRGMTEARGRTSGAVDEETGHEDYGGEETGSQVLTKDQRKQRNLLLGGQGSGKGQAPQAIVALPSAATTAPAPVGPSHMGPPPVCGHLMPHCQLAPWPSYSHCTSCGGNQAHAGQMVPYSGPPASGGPPSYPATQGQFVAQPPPSQQALQASVAGRGNQGQGGQGNGGRGQGGRGGGGRGRGRNGGGRGGGWNVFCNTASSVIVEIGKVRARACFFVMFDVDHPILLGRSFLCRTETLVFNRHDGTMILALSDPAYGNYEIIKCRNRGPGSGRNRPSLGSFTFEESENERRRLREGHEEEGTTEVLSLSLTNVNKAMEMVAAHDMADPEAIKALREQVLENSQLMGGMYLLTNTLLQGGLDRRGSFSHIESEILVPESQDDEFEEGEIKEAFRADEYDGVYRELGLLLSCKIRDRDASAKAQKMRHLYVERSAQRQGEALHPTLEREVGEVVHLDLLFMPAGENGCNYIFDARDNLTGFVDGRAIRTKTDLVLASCIEEYYLRYPFVKEFVMDRGSEFTCNEVRTLLAGYGVVANYTTAAHPQANALVERGHSTITNLLAKWTKGTPQERPQTLDTSKYASRLGELRTELGSWATGFDLGGHSSEQQEEEAMSEPAAAMAPRPSELCGGEIVVAAERLNEERLRESDTPECGRESVAVRGGLRP